MANPSRQPLPNRNKASTNLSHIGMQCWKLVAAHTWRVSYIIEILNRLLSPICAFRCLFPRNFLTIFVRGALLQSYHNWFPQNIRSCLSFEIPSVQNLSLLFANSIHHEMIFVAMAPYANILRTLCFCYLILHNFTHRAKMTCLQRQV